MFTVIWLFYL